MSHLRFIFIVPVAALLAVPRSADAACVASASGNWSSAATWSGCAGPGGIPAGSDDVTINSGRSVTLDIDATVAGLTFAANSANSALTHSGSNTLYVDGIVTFNQPTSNSRNNTWAISNGSATVTGLIQFLGTNTTTSRQSRLDVDNGVLNAYGGMSFTSSHPTTKRVLMNGGAGTINLKGALTAPTNSCTLTAGTLGSSFNYADDENAQTIEFFSAGNYHHLLANNTSSGGVTLTADLASNGNHRGDLRIQSGTFHNGGFSIAGASGDTFEVADGATFSMGGNSSLPTGFTSFTLSAASRIRFAQSTDDLDIPQLDYGHLDLMPSAAVRQRLPPGALTLLGDLTIGDGINAGIIDADVNDSVLTIAGSFLIQQDATFLADTGSTLTVGGDWTNDGVFTPNGNTVILDGVAAQDIDAGTDSFATVSITNSSAGGVTFTGPASASQISVDTGPLSSGTTLYFAAGSTMTVSILGLQGTSDRTITLLSTTPGSRWHLTNSVTYSVSYVRVGDSDASSGLRIFNNPAGEDLGNNLNWAVGLFPPSGFGVVGTSTGSISTEWVAPTSVPDSYRLQWSLSPDFSAVESTLDTGGLSAEPAVLHANATYYARVASVINGLESDWVETSTNTGLNPPLPAAETWAFVGISSITVAWNPNANAPGTRYILDISTTADFSGADSSSDTMHTDGTFTALDPATRYYARVKALAIQGPDSGYLILDSTSTLSVDPPPSFSFTGASTGSLTATWAVSSPPGDSYVFQYTSDPAFILSVTNVPSVDLTVTVEDLEVNTTYYGRVATVLSGSTGPWTAEISTATHAYSPAAAAESFLDVYFTSATLAWDGNGNPEGTTRYSIEMSTVSGFGSGDIARGEASALEGTVAQLDSGATYYARVRAVNHSGVPTAFLSLGSTVTRTVPLPKNLATVGATATALSFSWEASSPPGDTYDLRVSTDPSFSVVSFTTSTAGLSAVTTVALNPNTPYHAAVRSVIGVTENPWSPYVSTATVAAVPSATDWSVVTATEVSVSWSASGNADGTAYQVDLSTHSDFSFATVSSTTTGTTAAFSIRPPGMAHYARIRAFNVGGGESTIASFGSTDTLTATPPSGLSFLASSTGSLTFSWDPSSPAGDIYEVNVATSDMFDGTVLDDETTALFLSQSGLSVNTTYFVRLRARINGGFSDWSSNTSSATLALPPAIATPTWSGVTQSVVQMAWESNGNPPETLFEAELSDASDFVSGLVVATQTTGGLAVFSDMAPDTVFYGRARAMNHSGIRTDFETLGSTQTAAPNTCNATATGNWSSGGTWSSCTGPGGTPAATDAIIINSGRTVTLDIDATVAGLTFAANGTNSALTHSGSAVLVVNGPVTFNQPTTNSRNNQWNIANGSATVTGLITFAGTNTTTSRQSRLVIANGELNALGGMTFIAAASNTKRVLMNNGAGRINLRGALTAPANSCSLTAGTLGSAFSFSDPYSPQVVRMFSSGAYSNLLLKNSSSAGISLEAALTSSDVNGSVRVLSGKFDTSGYSVTGTTGMEFEVGYGATFQMSGTSALPTGFDTLVISTGSRIRYAQVTSPLSIPLLDYGHLDLVPPSSAIHVLPAGSLSVNGDLTIGSGSAQVIVDANANDPALSIGGALILSGGATLSASASETLGIGGAWLSEGSFNHNGGTVAFTGTDAQEIDARGASFSSVSIENGSSAGISFISSFSAANLSIDTSALGSSATIYFMAGTTATVTNAVLLGQPDRPISLLSTVPGDRWSFVLSGDFTGDRVYVRDSDASSGITVYAGSGSDDLGNNLNWDFGPPFGVADLVAAPAERALKIDLQWTAPADAPSANPLIDAEFIVDYTTSSVFAASSDWNPDIPPPPGVDRLIIATTSVLPGDACRVTLENLLDGATYFIRLWTTDAAGGVSVISNGATTYATPVVSSFTLSTNVISLGSLNPGATVVHTTPVILTNHGNTDVDFSVWIDDPVVWDSTSTPAGIDTFRLTGIFRDTLPFDSDFDPVSDVVLTSTKTASLVDMAKDGGPDGEKGFAVPPNEARTLWFRIEMPPISSTTGGQAIKFHVSVE